MRRPSIQHPESHMMSFGYRPELSEGAVKPPIFQTSTFAFRTAEEGKAYFEVAYGLREKDQSEELGLIYSRINNPNLEILEDRLCLWDGAEQCAVFESGMSAISTVLLEFVRPGDLLVYSNPTYGGTQHFIHHYLQEIGVHTLAFDRHDGYESLTAKIEQHPHRDRLRMIYIETPGNPTNQLIDIVMCRRVADHFASQSGSVQVAVDNTFMGPIWSQPLTHGADLVIYSATKYIGGHSDLIAGAVLGTQQLMSRIKTLRTFLGNMASPHTCWLLTRSLETLKVRMDQQCLNAGKVARFLSGHRAVERVDYLGLLTPADEDYEVYRSQYRAPGAMISMYLKGGEQDAFRFLNQLKLIKLAVSLGSTESLIQHPHTMTHIAVPKSEKLAQGITPNLVRLSVGLEHYQDIIRDISYALSHIKQPVPVL